MSKGIHRDRHAELLEGLAAYEADHGQLPGIADPAARKTLVEQMVSSLRRVEYVHGFRHRPAMSLRRVDPHSTLFDPLKGAFYLGSKGKRDEAVWIAFVGTHFGKHAKDAWKLAANVMGSFGQGPIWNAERYGAHTADFEAMLVAHQHDLKSKAISGRFSNHRQYQSKKPEKIAKVFATFHEWLTATDGINARVRQIHEKVGQEPTTVFKELYRSMEDVYGFGRLGTFDFLTMIAKLDLAPIEADSVHFAGATGPLSGAKLLVLGAVDAKGRTKGIEKAIDALDDYLLVGKQVLEDSLCNWQKSPKAYVYFQG
ncbi:MULTISPECIES: hypothetical protein [unclassified Devosia]|uniref:alpha-glutamyl/putrescinyl thymine pyrophosphorylase clade 3 protein n=1 Tax=unclassified Devosia TaxID=196773 RepID=UPI00086CC9B1|nr:MULTISPECIES: hypothetical protein [unclassified Devosia]MBN9360691.1 hypothetical protein [Devosia sp.]ODS87884.1 MAG: hypothetical protein ABS47_10885 [Devosia sp. SCN 66-27]OJX22660.1 MAG: hypothetical protein BGO83_17860 [Devosia sp. 66-14]